MQIKQRIIKGDPVKSRYGLQSKNCDSTPGLPQDKENNPLARNHPNPNPNHNNTQSTLAHTEKPGLQLMRSMEIPKRLRTSANEESRGGDNGLLSSQELFQFRQRNRTERHESATFGEHLTFGEVSKRPLMTSREFQQEKAIKNQVIDELIGNAQRELCKSFNEFSAKGSCANHVGKRAKYRLVSELSEGEEEMFYCSKCAINLLQQGFPIEEMRTEQHPIPSAALLRGQQVAKLELRLRALEERTRSEAELNERKEDLETLQEEIFSCNKKFGEFFEKLEAIRKDRINTLNNTYARIESEKQARREGLSGMLANMGDLQREIEEYRNINRFASMRENEFQFLATALTNKLAAFDNALAASRTPTPPQRISLEHTTSQGILDKLKMAIEEGPRTRRDQVTFQRREGSAWEGAGQSETDEWGCDELKKPFRILFPAEEGEEKRTLLSSVRECPSFGQYP